MEKGVWTRHSRFEEISLHYHPEGREAPHSRIHASVADGHQRAEVGGRGAVHTHKYAHAHTSTRALSGKRAAAVGDGMAARSECCATLGGKCKCPVCMCSAATTAPHVHDQEADVSEEEDVEFWREQGRQAALDVIEASRIMAERQLRREEVGPEGGAAGGNEPSAASVCGGETREYVGEAHVHGGERSADLSEASELGGKAGECGGEALSVVKQVAVRKEEMVPSGADGVDDKTLEKCAQQILACLRHNDQGIDDGMLGVTWCGAVLPYAG
jgi:hypothetical protein